MILNSLFIIPASVYAASSPWSQTNWAGGSGQTSWSDTTKFSSSSNVTTSTANQATLTNTEKFSNPGFETDLSSWNTGLSPDSISGLQLWLKADAISGLNDGDAVSTWSDSSGNGYNATQTNASLKPVYKTNIVNGKPVIRFDGSNDHLDTSSVSHNIGTSGFTWISVSQQTSSDTPSYRTIMANYQYNPGLYYYSGKFTVWWGANKFFSTVPTTSTWYILDLMRSSSTLSLNINGTTDATTFSIDTSMPNAAQNVGWDGFGGTLNGDIAEILVYNTNLSSSNRARIDNYLRDKYNITVSSGITSATRDTTTKYLGNASAKLVTSSSDTGEFTQSVNVGDTNTYNLSAYAYTTGTAVTSSDVELFYNGSSVSTTYTSVGSGWYQLTGTVTGANASRTYGVQVATNKTVYVDNFSLNNYASSGTLTSSIFDSGQRSDWGTLTYAATTPANTSVSVKVRTGNQSDLSDATAFSSCSAISSGSDISSNSCVTDTNRYIQYQLSLANTDSVSTPTFTSFSQTFSLSTPTAPSGLSGSAAGTTSITWSFTDNSSDESGFYVQDTSGNTKCTHSTSSAGSGQAVSCTETDLSPNTSYTRKVVAYNGSGNSTASSNASATTRAVPSPSLDSPSDNTYTTGDRPSFRFKTPTDNTTAKLYSDVSSYRLYVKDSDGKEIFSISGIPSSRTTDYTDDPKYVAKYENFGDSDITNNYITVYTRSTANWGSSENDGKLKEGKNTWAVASRDGSNNEAASERTIYYDTTAPVITLAKLGSFSFNPKYTDWYYTQLKPTLTGKASEQGTVNIVFDKKGFNTGVLGGYGNFITANVNTDSSGNFSWTPELEYGQYQVTIKAKDQAGNTSSEIKFNLTVDTYDNLVSQGIIKTSSAKSTSEESLRLRSEPPSGVSPTPKEGGPIIPPEPNVVQKAASVIPDLIGNLYKSSTAWIPAFAGMTKEVGKGIASSVNFLAMTTRKGINVVGSGLAFVFDKTGQDLAFAGHQVGNGVSFIANATGSGLNFVSSTIAQGYNNLADNAPGFAKTVLIGIRDGVTTVGKGIADTTTGIAKGMGNVIASGSEAISHSTKIAASSIGNGLLAMTNKTKEGVAQLAFNVGERTERFSDSLGFTIVKLGYLFVNEPTTISDVKVAKLDLTTAKITWNTNHPATSKVNYGLTQDFGNDIQSQKRVTQHEIVITGLKPNTQYFYEVMSQNKNYVFDANHNFITLDDGSKKEKTNEKPVKNNRTKPFNKIGPIRSNY